MMNLDQSWRKNKSKMNLTGAPGKKEIKVISGNKVCAKFEFKQVYPNDGSIDEHSPP